MVLQYKGKYKNTITMYKYFTIKIYYNNENLLLLLLFALRYWEIIWTKRRLISFDFGGNMTWTWSWQILWRSPISRIHRHIGIALSFHRRLNHVQVQRCFTGWLWFVLVAKSTLNICLTSKEEKPEPCTVKVKSLE